MSLHNISIREQCPTVADNIYSPLAKYIALAANDCGYNGTTEDPIVNYIYHFFLQVRSDASKKDIPNWCEATRGSFVNDY